MIEKSETFLEKIHECNQHKLRLSKAKRHLEKIMPLNEKNYKNLDDISMGFIDQLIFRFSKLQDTMGDKLFSSFLVLTGEDIKKMTFIDRLNRLEELAIINKNEWITLRTYRNDIAHEYSFNQDEVVASINIIYEISDQLIVIYDLFIEYCKNKLEFMK
ncbi:hypothetical protein EW093_13005 [Thiospirochaeta perfilievii]|uniref:Toxin-antitoxin system antitoxin subunit n=1 Tax=Thiospirochaeta perfilievii TaxID=252967 RepID=A0A5C1QBZ2_9SPIO|nr:hypothetical protein [Thiospirochaeta perfilievii]QEN05593.1 hypothetical protein EW093_13005 [Thiospirochaeta perfilievii]